MRERLNVLHQELNPGVRSSSTYTVREAVDDWLREGLDGTSERTRTLYEGLLEPVLEVIGAKPLRVLSARDVRSAPAQASRCATPHEGCTMPSADRTFPLESTVALVTGSSSGIGAATASRLAAEGAAVALVARRRDRLEELTSEIRRDGGTALVVQADVTKQEQAVAAVEQAAAELGRLDIVVNSAGLMLLGPALETPADEWDRMVALNVQGLLYVTHAALPHLARAADDSPRRVADLVNISSTAGRVTRPGSSVYNLTKFGITAFSEALCQELISHRVRVSVVEPGTVDTELASHLREDIRQAAQGQMDSIEPLRPDDIADTVAYIVTRDRRVAVNEILVRASEQTW